MAVGVGRAEVVVPSQPLDASSAALLVFNLLDGLFTLTFLQLGVASEANPLMRAFYALDPSLFMISKLALVHAGYSLLAWQRHHPMARFAIHGGALLYAAIVAYHLSFLYAL